MMLWLGAKASTKYVARVAEGGILGLGKQASKSRRHVFGNSEDRARTAASFAVILEEITVSVFVLTVPRSFS